MRCPSCQSTNRDDARFCHACGEPLTTSVADRKPPRRQPPEEPGDDDQFHGWRSPAPVEQSRKRRSTPATTAPPKNQPVVTSDDHGSELRGVVRGFTARTETRQGASRQPDSVLVWDFELERHDQHGRPLPRIPVQMRAQSFSAAIRDGQTVIVKGRYRPGKTLRTKRVWNESTQTLVKPVGVSSITRNVIGVALLAVFAFFVFTTMDRAWDANLAYNDLEFCQRRVEMGFPGAGPCVGSLEQIRAECEEWPPLIGEFVCDSVMD